MTQCVGTIPADDVPDLHKFYHTTNGALEALFVKAINTGAIIAVDENGAAVPFTLEVIKE